MLIENRWLCLVAIMFSICCSGYGQQNTSNIPSSIATLMPDRTLGEWADAVEKISFSQASEKTPKDLKCILHGNLKNGGFLGDKLKGGTLTIIFKNTQHIQSLGLMQYGYDKYWAQPKRISISVDDATFFSVDLTLAPTIELPKTAGKIQGIALDRSCKKLAIRFDDVFPGTQAWGGIGAIGPVMGSESIYKFTRALPQSSTAIEMEITSPCDATATLSAQVLARKIFFPGPKIELRKGRHAYRISIAEFRPKQNYGFIFNPGLIESLKLNINDVAAVITIDNVKSLPENAPEDTWPSLPAFTPPTKTVDGLCWTEGMSYSSAGKFANCTYAPLLLETVYPSWFQVDVPGAYAPRRQIFSFFPQLNTPVAPSSDAIQEVNWISLQRRITYPDGNFVKLTCGAAAPGFLLESSRPVRLFSLGTGDAIRRSGAVGETEDIFNRLPALTGNRKLTPSMVVTAAGIQSTASGKVDFAALSEPWAVTLWKLDGPPDFYGDHYLGLLFTSDSGILQWDDQGIILPAGIIGLSTAFAGELGNGLSAASIAARAGMLTRMLRTYPVACQEWYAVTSSDVKIRDEFSYYRWGRPQWQANDYAPIPPLFAWTADSVGKIKLPSPENNGIITPCGPYRWRQGSTLEYSISRIPATHAAFPRLRGQDKVWGQMSEDLCKVKNPFEQNTVYKWQNVWYHAFSAYDTVKPKDSLPWTAAIVGYSLFDEAAQVRLLQLGRNALLESCKPCYWLSRKERWTGRPYIANGWVDASTLPIMLGDANTMCATVFYGQYLYSKYSGDWALASANWPRLMDMLRYMEVVNDWAAPTTSARESARFGGIDMDTVSYEGLCGMEKMAETLHLDADCNRIAYLRAKTAWSALMRLNFKKWLDPQGRIPELTIDGFGENQAGVKYIPPAVKLTEEDYSLASAVYSWIGQQPEMYQALNTVFSEQLLSDYQRKFIEKEYPGWRDQEYWIGVPADFIAARAWLKSWPDKELDKDYREWLQHIRTKSIWGETNCWKNGVAGDVPPPFRYAGMMAVLQGRKAGIYLTDWEPAKLGACRYDPANCQFTVELNSSKPLTLKLHSPLRPARIMLDGQMLNQQFDNIGKDEYSIKLLPCKGILTVTFKAMP